MVTRLINIRHNTVTKIFFLWWRTLRPIFLLFFKCFIILAQCYIFIIYFRTGTYSFFTDWRELCTSLYMYCMSIGSLRIFENHCSRDHRWWRAGSGGCLFSSPRDHFGEMLEKVGLRTFPRFEGEGGMTVARTVLNYMLIKWLFPLPQCNVSSLPLSHRVVCFSEWDILPQE